MNYFDTGIESVESQSKSIDFDKILTEMPSDQAEKLKVDLYSQNDNSGIPLIYQTFNQDRV